MSKKTTVTSKKLPEIKLKNKAKLILQEPLKKQIDYLHSKVGEIEWSGVLLYRIVKGTIDDPANLVIEATDMHLMDIGTAAFTEFDLEYEDVKKIHELYEESDPFKMGDTPEKMLRKGMIHTHHSMNAYFSPTDDDELQDNTPNHDMYLSLIVNFAGEYCANLAFTAETSGEYKVVGREEVLTSSENKYLIRIDTDIEINLDDTVPEHVVNRYKEVDLQNVSYNYTPGNYTPTTITELSTFSTLEFLQRLFKVIDTDSNVVHGTLDARKKNLNKMIKNCDKIVKKLGDKKLTEKLEEVGKSVKQAVNVTKSVNQSLSVELVCTYIEESMEYIYDELITPKTPKNSILYTIIEYFEENEKEIVYDLETDTKIPLAYANYNYGSYDDDYYGIYN